MTSHLFSPLALRGMTMPNRVAVAPMCQYSAVDGTVGDWHVMHLGSLALAGPGMLIIEATGVEAVGRISPGCTGLYSDQNEAAFARAIAFCRSVSDSPIGIQLGHAGRKASAHVPWHGGGSLAAAEGAWETSAPSAVPFTPAWHTPTVMDDAALTRVRDAFVAATLRAERLGLELIEVHAAHGYLLHQFLSPLSNRRDDAYGGDAEGRMRFPLEVFDAVRAAFPDDKPVTVRLSATDWVEGGWDVEQSIAFSDALKARGCDLIHVSSGGLSTDQKIEGGPGYQTDFASAIRHAVDIPVMAVGEIKSPIQAETIIRSGQADSVALAREMLSNPRWIWHAAQELGVTIPMIAQYARSNHGLDATTFEMR